MAHVSLTRKDVDFVAKIGGLDVFRFLVTRYLSPWKSSSYAQSVRILAVSHVFKSIGLRIIMILWQIIGNEYFKDQ